MAYLMQLFHLRGIAVARGVDGPEVKRATQRGHAASPLLLSAGRRTQRHTVGARGTTSGPDWERGWQRKEHMHICIVVVVIMSNPSHPVPSAVPHIRLARLLAEAADARSSRVSGGPEGCGIHECDWNRSRRAALMHEALLTGPMPRSLDVGAFLSRAASLQLMATGGLSEMWSSIEVMRMSAWRVRALAAVLAEIVHFIDTGISADGSASLRLVVASEGDRIVIGVSAQGDYAVVGTAGGARALLRAMRLVEALGGDFGRGSDGEAMVFGIVLHRRDAGDRRRRPTIRRLRG